MCADSLVSLTPVVWEYVIKITHGSSAQVRGKDDGETETADRLVPTRWVIIGLCVSVAIGIVLVWLVFGHEGIKPAATFVGYIIGGLLSVLA